MGYVVYCVESLQDGREEWAKVCANLSQAIQCMERRANYTNADHTILRLFELGPEIRLLRKKVVEVEKTKKTTVKFQVAKGKENTCLD